MFFHRRYQVSPASDIALLTKPRTPLASEHLTPFFGLSVEEKLVTRATKQAPSAGPGSGLGQANVQPAH